MSEGLEEGTLGLHQHILSRSGHLLARTDLLG